MFKTLLDFLTEKGIESMEKFLEMSAEKQAEIYNELNKVNREAYTELEKKIGEGVTKEQLDSFKQELRKGQIEQLQNLNKAMEAQGVAIKKLTAKEKADMPKGSLRDGLEANKDKFLEMNSDEDGADKNVRVSFKAPADMLISTNVSGGNVPVEQRLAGLDRIASRQIRLLDIISRGTASSNVISWVYQANQDGSAGGTAEGAVKNQIDFDLVVASETVKKRTAFIKISEEMLGDIDFMESEIRMELMQELLKDVENQVYQGDGLGNNLNGIKTVATAFAAGSFAGTIDSANAVDVLTVANNQIMIAEHGMATYILMHPSDVTALKMVKVTSADKRYVERLAIVAGQLSLDGIPIIPTTLVTQDDYLIGVFDFAMMFERAGGISIEVGRDSDDFTKNMVTILAEWRGLVLVKNNKRTGFVTGDFTTDAAALETP